MNFQTFLKQSNDILIGEEKKVICFNSEVYPLLFFRYLFFNLAKTYPDIGKQELIDINSIDLPGFFSLLGQSFLGQSKVYWLGDCGGRLDKKKSKIFDFLKDYQGPHTIILFASNLKENNNVNVINLPDILNQAAFFDLASFLEKRYSLAKKELISKIFSRVSTVSIDEACRLIDCLDLVGNKAFDLFERYLSLFLEPEKSLFTLSSHFFSRNDKAFFALWKDVYKDYPDVFWIMYWSDQIWKAYFVVKFSRQKNFAAVKRVSYRLPFSFSKTHWQNYSLSELMNAHDFLYKADFALKTGSNFCFLDLFLVNHFSKKFVDGKIIKNN